MFKYGRVIVKRRMQAISIASIVVLRNSKATSLAMRKDRARRMLELLRLSNLLAVAIEIVPG